MRNIQNSIRQSATAAKIVKEFDTGFTIQAIQKRQRIGRNRILCALIRANKLNTSKVSRGITREQLELAETAIRNGKELSQIATDLGIKEYELSACLSYALNTPKSKDTKIREAVPVFGETTAAILNTRVKAERRDEDDIAYIHANVAKAFLRGVPVSTIVRTARLPLYTVARAILLESCIADISEIPFKGQSSRKLAVDTIQLVKEKDSVEEVARSLGVSKQTVYQKLRIILAYPKKPNSSLASKTEKEREYEKNLDMSPAARAKLKRVKRLDAIVVEMQQELSKGRYPKTARNRKILKLRQAGHTLAEIASSFGISRERVSQVLKAQHKEGVVNSGEIANRKEQVKQRLAIERFNRMQRSRSAGLTLEDIAEIEGLSRGRVSQIFMEFEALQEAQNTSKLEAELGITVERVDRSRGPNKLESKRKQARKKSAAERFSRMERSWLSGQTFDEIARIEGVTRARVSQIFKESGWEGARRSREVRNAERAKEILTNQIKSLLSAAEIAKIEQSTEQYMHKRIRKLGLTSLYKEYRKARLDRVRRQKRKNFGIGFKPSGETKDI